MVQVVLAARLFARHSRGAAHNRERQCRGRSSPSRAQRRAPRAAAQRVAVAVAIAITWRRSAAPRHARAAAAAEQRNGRRRRRGGHVVGCAGSWQRAAALALSRHACRRRRASVRVRWRRNPRHHCELENLRIFNETTVLIFSSLVFTSSALPPRGYTRICFCFKDAHTPWVKEPF